MTHFPPPAIHERRRLLIRRLGMALSALMVLTVLVIFGLILRSESAHDEADCPFAALGERSLGNTRVYEESRRCLPEVEERRWLVQNQDGARYELARKRLDRARFTPERFVWTLERDDKQLLVIKLSVDGELLSEFHEADAVGRAP